MLRLHKIKQEWGSNRFTKENCIKEESNFYENIAFYDLEILYMYYIYSLVRFWTSN